MYDLTTRYLGLTIKNPIIAASSGLTGSLDMLKELEKEGIGAIVLKSVFEEEILMEHEKSLKEMDKFQSTMEYLDYYDYKLKDNNLGKYYDLITQAKKNLSVPVIASINCISAGEWINFAKKFQDAGADALELNVFIMPSDAAKSGFEIEKSYIEIIEGVMEHVNIPVSVKMSSYFSGLANMISKIAKTKVAGIVLFNRFYNPDFDITNLKVSATNVLSTPDEFSNVLRWIAIMSGQVDCSLVATTGIHDGKTIIKQLLAGADAIQIASVLYKKGPSYIDTMLKDIESWMRNHQFTNIDQFRGKLSQNKTRNPAEFERVQFMKYFSDK